MGSKVTTETKIKCVLCNRNATPVSMDRLYRGITERWSGGNFRDYRSTDLWACNNQKKCKQRVRKNSQRAMEAKLDSPEMQR